LLVPTGAILFQTAGPQVAVVDTTNHVQLRKVSIGRDFGNNIEVTAGITQTDALIANPPDFLVDGMPVTPQSAPRAERSGKGRCAMISPPRLSTRQQPAGLLRAGSLLLLSTSMLTGCMVGPRYHAPAVPAPPAFQEQHAVATSQAASPADWWTIFKDPVLNNLEHRRSRQIWTSMRPWPGSIRLMSSVGLPAPNGIPPSAAQPQYGRTREARDRPNNGNTGGKAATYNDLQLPLTLSYEVDAWRRIRRQVRAASETEQASSADLQFVRLTVETSLASDYFSLREADAEAEIVTQTQADLQRGFEVTTNQFHRGIISELAVRQSQVILEQARAQLEIIHLRRAQSEHALAILSGVPAEGFHVLQRDSPEIQPEIPPSVPAAMLGRRPDILAAERPAAAASEQIGIATAAFYPQFVLNGNAGVESAIPASIFNWQNTIASLIGSATAPIFSGGRLRANVDQATAVFRENVSNYGKAVLLGYGDVEDQLTAIHYLARQAEAETSVVASAKRSEQIAATRYKAGLLSYLDVVFAQQTLLQNEQTLTQLKGSRRTRLSVSSGPWAGNGDRPAADVVPASGGRLRRVRGGEWGIRTPDRTFGPITV